jgi:hypothetical protein
MTFRHMLLTCGCAALLLTNPVQRTLPLSASASVVWGACTSWLASSFRVPLDAHVRATPQRAGEVVSRTGRQPE